MSVPAAPAAAPAAAVPPSAPATPPATAPASAPPATPPAGDVKVQGRGSRIFSLLAAESASEPGKPAAKTEPPASAAATPATPAADGKPSATPPVEDPQIRAKKPRAIAKRPDPTPATPTPAATPAATPVATAPESDDDLIEEEKQLLADAEEAERHLPSRKGLKDQVRKFLREQTKYLDKHPDLESDDQETRAEAEKEFDTWLRKNRPVLTDVEQRSVTEGRIAAKVRQPLEEKTQQLEHEIFVRDEEPKIEQRVRNETKDVMVSVMPKEVMEFAEKYGVEAARSRYADEITVVNTVVNNASAAYREFLRLEAKDPKTGRYLTSPVLDRAKDPERFDLHEKMAKITDYIDNDFKENSTQKDLVRDGKWFCTRVEWNAGYSKSPERFWTFTNAEIAKRSLDFVKPAIDTAIARNQTSLKARGLQRVPFVPPAAPAAAPTATNTPPGPGSSPVPPPLNGAPPAATPGGRLSQLLGAG